MKSILSFLRSSMKHEPATSEAVRRIAGELDHLEPETARFVAGYAVLLSRIAAADHDITDDEVGLLERLVREKGGLAAPQASLVVELATKHQRLLGGTEDFLVTRELARTASYEQKLSLLGCLFAVAAADSRIRIQEGDEIGRIATELRIEQRDLSRIRHEYRDFLSVRRRADGTLPPTE